jgi:hypothetical protein
LNFYCRERNLKKEINKKIAKREEIDNVEAVCELVTRYLIEYTFKKENQSTVVDEYEPCLRSSQILALVEALLCPSAETLGTLSTAIDLTTLVAILNSAKVPKLLSQTPSQSQPSSSSLLSTTSRGSEKSTGGEQTNELMNNLVASFLSQSFLSEPDVNSVVAAATASTPTSKDTFAKLNRTHFLKANGVKAFLNECDLTLTYLNVYRKNHLKLVLNPTHASPSTSSSSLDKAVTYEEALQAKAK